jgi:outer membrane immunogenic protein
MQVRALLIGMVVASFAAGAAQAMDVWQPPDRAKPARHSAPAYDPPPRFNSAPSYGPAPDYSAAPAYNPAAFNFDGFYLGAQGGLGVGGLHAGSIGVVAGTNFTVSDPVIAGIEFQADALLKGGGNTYDFYALGRAGMVVNSDLMVYAEAGPGWSAGVGGYAFGGGAEYALTDVLSVKGEAQGLGNWGAGPSGAKLQAGLLFHLQ